MRMKAKREKRRDKKGVPKMLLAEMPKTIDILEEMLKISTKKIAVSILSNSTLSL